MGQTRMFRDRVVSMEQTLEGGEKHLHLLRERLPRGDAGARRFWSTPSTTSAISSSWYFDAPDGRHETRLLDADDPLRRGAHSHADRRSRGRAALADRRPSPHQRRAPRDHGHVPPPRGRLGRHAGAAARERTAASPWRAQRRPRARARKLPPRIGDPSPAAPAGGLPGAGRRRRHADLHRRAVRPRHGARPPSAVRPRRGPTAPAEPASAEAGAAGAGGKKRRRFRRRRRGGRGAGGGGSSPGPSPAGPGSMNFEFSEDQTRIRDAVREFAASEIAPRRRAVGERKRLPPGDPGGARPDGRDGDDGPRDLGRRRSRRALVRSRRRGAGARLRLDGRDRFGQQLGGLLSHLEVRHRRAEGDDLNRARFRKGARRVRPLGAAVGLGRRQPEDERRPRR